MQNAKQPLHANDTVSLLNAALRNALTGINQYFLHARMLKHKKFMKLADYEYKESLDTMKFTDQLVNLILSLGGAPNLQELGKLAVGQTVPEILKNDMALVDATRTVLTQAIDHCGKEGQEAATSVLSAMLASENEHAGFIKEQLNLIDTMGLNPYLQTQG